MIRDKMKLVLDGKTAASESEVIPNTIGEMLFVQVDGDASAFTMQVLGRCNRSGGQFVNLTGFDGAFNLKSSITEIKVNLISVVSGSVSAYVTTTTAKG